MGLLDQMFGKMQKQSVGRGLKEEALLTIDSLNAQIVQLEENPDIPEAEKAEQIRLLKQEIKTFATSMGWESNE